MWMRYIGYEEFQHIILLNYNFRHFNHLLYIQHCDLIIRMVLCLRKCYKDDSSLNEYIIIRSKLQKFESY